MMNHSDWQRCLFHHAWLHLAGVAIKEKLVLVRDAMKKEGATLLLTAALDEIAWLFNLRGDDVDSTTIFLSYAWVTLDAVRLYINPAKLTDPVRQYLATVGEGVHIHDYDNFMADLTIFVEKTGEAGSSSSASVMYDPAKVIRSLSVLNDGEFIDLFVAFIFSRSL